MFRLAQTPIKLCIQIAVDMISCNLLYLRGGGGESAFFNLETCGIWQYLFVTVPRFLVFRNSVFQELCWRGGGGGGEVNLSSWLVELQLLVKCSTCRLAEISKFSPPPSLPSSLTLIVVHKLHNLVKCRSLYVFITYLFVIVVAAVMDGKGWQ